MRTKPLESYVEILGLANAAYVAQHLHNHLYDGLGLDVLLPTGICSAIRMASFISVMRDRPEAFSLFSCGPQPLESPLASGTDDDTADDLMRMQLKISDSTTGLSDKHIKKLTIVKHTVPAIFKSCLSCWTTWSALPVSFSERPCRLCPCSRAGQSCPTRKVTL